MKLFLGLLAMLAWGFGGILLLAPAWFYAPTGIVMTPMIATLAQAHGATLIGLGLINWLARSAGKQGLQAVFIGNFVVQGLSLCVVIRMVQFGAGGTVGPGVLIHAVLGGLCAFYFIKVCRI